MERRDGRARAGRDSSLRRDPRPLLGETPNGWVRRVRWIVAGLAVLQLASHQPSGGEGEFDHLGPGGLVVGGLALLNIVSFVRERRGTQATAREQQVETAAATILAVALAFVLRADPSSTAWGLLALVTIEGAVRAGLAGSVAVWVGGSVLTVVTEAVGRATGDIVVGVGHLAPRLGVVLVVALSAGLLSDRLTLLARHSQDEHQESERRARLLAVVAAAARTMTSLDADRVLAGIIDAAIGLDFEAAEICLLDEANGTWRPAHTHVPVPGYRIQSQPVEAGMAGVVFQRGETFLVEDYSSWAGALDSLRGSGLRGVIAVPVWTGGRMAAILTAGRIRHDPVTPFERECMELLAAQAGAALHNVNRYVERQDLERQLAHQAFHDSLTGLPNRALFLDRLEHALARSSRGAQCVGVLFCDLDGFKLVNDRMGHQAGDELLTIVAGRLVDCVRPGDTVARFGGDEFVILLEGIAAEAEAAAVADRIMRTLDNTVLLGDVEVAVSASIGVAAGQGGEGADALLRRADSAMYLAKERGKRRVQRYEHGIETRVLAGLELEADLRRAIGRGDIEVHFQPIVAADGGDILALEALARWNHPVHGAVSPASFIPVAERSGLIAPLGRHVLEHACLLALGWTQPGNGAPVRLNVNVSFRQLDDPDFMHDLQHILDRTAFPAERLTLELTEGTVMHEGDTALDVLNEIKAIGVRLAVDDFGQGFSSLRYLRELPVDEVKLDRSLVVGTVTTAEDRAIVRWTVELAHELGLVVTAEGVETVDQLTRVRALGVDHIQGYLAHRPMRPSELDDLLRPGHARPVKPVLH